SVARRVTESCDGFDPGSDLAARLETLHVAGDVPEDAPRIEEIALYRAFRLRHVCVVHPEIPFRLGHGDLGIRKNLRAVFALDAVDMIRMEMRDQDRVDYLRVNPRGLEVVEQAT